GELGARGEQVGLRLLELRRQGPLVERRQRVALVNRAADVDGNIGHDARRPRHDVHLLTGLDRTRIAEHGADWANAGRRGTYDEACAAWRAALLRNGRYG